MEARGGVVSPGRGLTEESWMFMAIFESRVSMHIISFGSVVIGSRSTSARLSALHQRPSIKLVTAGTSTHDDPLVNFLTTDCRYASYVLQNTSV